MHSDLQVISEIAEYRREITEPNRILIAACYATIYKSFDIVCTAASPKNIYEFLMILFIHSIFIIISGCVFVCAQSPSCD